MSEKFIATEAGVVRITAQVTLTDSAGKMLDRETAFSLALDCCSDAAAVLRDEPIRGH